MLNSALVPYNFFVVFSLPLHHFDRGLDALGIREKVELPYHVLDEIEEVKALRLNFKHSVLILGEVEQIVDEVERH